MGVKMTDVSDAPPAVAAEIERYLLTGSSDPLSAAWPGNIVERGIQAHLELRAALVRAVRRRETKQTCDLPRCFDPVSLHPHKSRADGARSVSAR